MKIIIPIISLFILGVFTYIFTWDIPVPEKEVKKEINILLKRKNQLIKLKVTPTDITNLQNN